MAGGGRIVFITEIIGSKYLSSLSCLGIPKETNFRLLPQRKSRTQSVGGSWTEAFSSTWPCWSFVHRVPTMAQTLFGTLHTYLPSTFINISQEALYLQMKKTEFKMFKQLAHRHSASISQNPGLPDAQCSAPTVTAHRLFLGLCEECGSIPVRGTEKWRPAPLRPVLLLGAE